MTVKTLKNMIGGAFLSVFALLVFAIISAPFANADQALRASEDNATASALILSGSGGAPDVLTYSRQILRCNQNGEIAVCNLDLVIGQDYDSTNGAGNVRLEGLAYEGYVSDSSTIKVPIAATLITSPTSGSLWLSISGTTATFEVHNIDGEAVDYMEWTWLESGSGVQGTWAYTLVE